MYPFQEYFLIKNKNKVGIIDANEKMIVPPIYDEIRPFKEERAIVISDKKYGVIDKSGKEIVHPQYEYIQDFSNGMAMIITQGRKAGFLNEDGVEVVNEIFRYTQPFKGESTMVILDKEFGVIDKNGTYTIKLQNERINPLGNDLYSIKDNGKMYLLDKNGHKISEQGYESIGEQVEELISVSSDNKFGYIDSNGKVIIPISYTELGEPQNKLIIAKDKITQKFGVINLDNKFVVEPKYDYILSRNDNFFIVGDENFKEGIINTSGEVLLPLEYSNLEFKYNNLAVGNNKNEDYKFIQVNNRSSLVLDVNPAEVIDYNNNEIITQNKEGTKIYKINGEK
ncbi:MAG: WG repeat-containing protein [Cetobacterium sp.]